MDIINKEIDGGKAFDWGRASSDYAKFRDIYPPIFYNKVVERGLCIKGQKVLDLGTGTGVIPRNMYSFGADWVGADISEGQIEQAKRLAAESNMDIKFITSPAEDIDFPDGSFDVITACQCFFYFDYDKVIPNISRMLKNGGKLVVLFMAWVPDEDEVARASEELVLKYNPTWTGAGYKRAPVYIPEIAEKYFNIEAREEYDLMMPFTRETWNGRMKACRGVGASLTPAEIDNWEKEHKALLEKIAPPEFEILHHAAMAVLERK